MVIRIMQVNILFLLSRYMIIFFCKFHGPFSLPDKLFALDLPYEVMIGSKILQLKNN